MANIKSQIKRNKQSEMARQKNKAIKSALKTQIKKVSEAAAGKNKEQAKELLALTIKSLDKAASKRVIHPNQAARKKSKLTSKINTLKGS